MRIAVACTAVAAALLLVFDEATYDPTAWLIWGRQIAGGTLDTVGGPTWKPLPVLLTTPFSLAGDSGAMWLWLVVARVGGLLSLIVAYRLAARLGGSRVAGVVAAVALLLAAEYQLNWLRGNSEGLLVMFSLLAVLRHLDGHRRQAFGCAAAAALMRPDVWPLFGLYGLWLLWRARDLRTAALVFGAGGAVLASWLVPEYIGSGDFFRGVTRAQEVVPGSPGSTDRAFFGVFANGAQSLSYGVYAGAVLSLVVALRDRRLAALAAGATMLMCVVAAGATGPGFTGSLRYVTLPASLVCVLSGVGWAWLAGRLRGRARVGLAVAALAAVPGVALSVDRYGEDVDRAYATDRRLSALPGFIERAGREEILGCGRLYTGPFSTQVVAYRLDILQRDVGIRPAAPGTILDATDSPLDPSPGFVRKVRESQWTLQSTC
ncbi:MAG: glycosyltransferase 87 family protein [Solirubrobacteraceae bacterium]